MQKRDSAKQKRKLVPKWSVLLDKRKNDSRKSDHVKQQNEHKKN